MALQTAKHQMESKWLSWPHCLEQKGRSMQVQHHDPDHDSWPPLCGRQSVSQQDASSTIHSSAVRWQLPEAKRTQA